MKMPKPTEILHLKSQSQFIMDSYVTVLICLRSLTLKISQ